MGGCGHRGSARGQGRGGLRAVGGSGAEAGGGAELGRGEGGTARGPHRLSGVDPVGRPGPCTCSPCAGPVVALPFPREDHGKCVLAG